MCKELRTGGYRRDLITHFWIQIDQHRANLAKHTPNEHYCVCFFSTLIDSDQETNVGSVTDANMLADVMLVYH